MDDINILIRDKNIIISIVALNLGLQSGGEGESGGESGENILIHEMRTSSLRMPDGFY